MERRIGASLYITALVISLTIFIGGIMAGIWLSSLRERAILGYMSKASDSLSDLATQQEAVSLFPEDCKLVDSAINNLVSEMGKIESELSRIENARPIERIGYDELRKKYQLMSIRYYLYTQRFDKCMGNRVSVLYFYTKDCRRCEDEGFILTTLKKKYDGNLLVFPVDASLGIGSVKMLVEYYNITSFPSLVIDGQKHGYMGKEELESILKSRVRHN